MRTSTPSERIDAALGQLTELRRRIEKMDPDSMDLLAIEGDTRALLDEVGLAVVAEAMRRADAHAPEVEVHGERWTHRRESKAEYHVAFGKLEVSRAIYQQAGRGKILVPTDLRLGFVEGRYSPTVARAVAHAAAVTTAEEAEGLLFRLGLRVSKSTVHRLANAMAAREVRQRARIEPAVRAADPVPDAAAVVQVALDGVMVPQDGALAKARGRPTEEPSPPRHETRYGPMPRGPAATDGKEKRAWHEASVGTVAYWDAEGKHLKTVYLGEMPEERKQTLVERLEAELDATLTARPTLRVAFASDGAPVHWDQLEAMRERLQKTRPRFEARMLVDAAHVSHYLYEAAKITDGIGGESTPESKARAAQWKTLMQEALDGPDRVLKSLRYFRDRQKVASKREALDATISFLAGQHEHGRLRYAEAKAEKLPIGTGPTEAAAKTLVNVRMKRAGARYAQHGGQTILTFRAALLSERLDLLAAELEATYRATVRERAA